MPYSARKQRFACTRTTLILVGVAWTLVLLVAVVVAMLITGSFPGMGGSGGDEGSSNTQLGGPVNTEPPLLRNTKSPTTPRLVTTSPSFTPSFTPSSTPSSLPSFTPSSKPSSAPLSATPSIIPSATPSSIEEVAVGTFFAIADAPYNRLQDFFLPSLIATVPEDGDFLVHLGDIKGGAPNLCTKETFHKVELFLKASPIPVFVLVGDNEFNDCSNPNQALELWREFFVRFDKKYWTHSLNVSLMPERPESFTFVHKRSLYFGLNIVSGDIQSGSEWNNRLTGQLDWVKEVTNTNLASEDPVSAIIILGHGIPGSRKTTLFFHPLREYVMNVLGSSIPILYLCGDAHRWVYAPRFFNQPNWLRVTIEGGVEEPPNRITVDTTKSYVEDVITIDRWWTQNYLGPSNTTEADLGSVAADRGEL